MKKIFIGIAVFSLVVAVAFVSFFQRKEMKESIENGRQVYTQLCLDCHGENGKGEGSLIGTSINNQHFLSVFSNEDIINMIENGRPDAKMPAYSFLEKGDRENLVSFIRSWQTKPLKLEEPSIIEGNAENGKQLYQSYCMTCHGQTGSGFSTAAAAIANPDTLKQLTDNQMWKTIAYGREETRMGPSLKGQNGVKQLESQDISDIVIYIRNDLAEKYNALESKP